MLDLHQYLTDLPSPVSFSTAVSIAENGDIFGYAFNWDDVTGDNPPPPYIIVWHPVPEPVALTTMLVGLGTLSLCTRRRLNS